MGGPPQMGGPPGDCGCDPRDMVRIILCCLFFARDRSHHLVQHLVQRLCSGRMGRLHKIGGSLSPTRPLHLLALLGDFLRDQLSLLGRRPLGTKCLYWNR